MNSEEKCDLYQILGVKKDASNADIKKAFRQLSTKYYPDKCTNIDSTVATDRFLKIKSAYEILINDASKEKYNKFSDIEKVNFYDSIYD